jgi:hypothetical protein
MGFVVKNSIFNNEQMMFILLSEQNWLRNEGKIVTVYTYFATKPNFL